MGRVVALTAGVGHLSPRLAGLLRKTGSRKPALGGLIDGAIAKNTIAKLSGAETDRRLLAVRVRFSRGWNLVDFKLYLIGYL